MLATHELRHYAGYEKVWAGKYLGLQNLPHWHLDCEIIYADKGEAEISVNGKIYTLAAAQTMLINSGEIHYIKAQHDTILSIFLFDASIVKKVFSAVMLKEPLLRKTYDIPAIFDRAKKELMTKPLLYDVSVNTEMLKLVLDIIRAEETLPAGENKNAANLKYKDLLKEIEEKFDYYSFKDAAKFMNFSEAYFSKYFHAISGITFSKYLNIIRTERALEMIKQDRTLSMTDIANRCGFDTTRNFNRIFKALTGYSPKQIPQSYSMNPTSVYSSKEPFDPTLNTSKLM